MKHTILAAMLALVAAPAFAQTTFQNGSSQATATINNACTIVSSSGIAFGSYNSVTTHRTAHLEGQSSIQVRCTAGTSGVFINMMAGNSASVECGEPVPGRRMRLGTSGSYLNYELYKDSNRAEPWGCAVGNDLDLPTSTSSTAAYSLTLYGRVPAGQSGNVGSYTDTVQMVVNF